MAAPDLKNITIAGKIWQVSPLIYEPLKRAAAAMYAATGKHPQIVYAYRSTEKQAELYKRLKAENPAAVVAPPGKSFHERGQALDIANWREAERFFRAQGFLNPLANDKVHFSIGEFKPGKEAAIGAAGLLITAGIVFILAKYLIK